MKFIKSSKCYCSNHKLEAIFESQLLLSDDFINVLNEMLKSAPNDIKDYINKLLKIYVSKEDIKTDFNLIGLGKLNNTISFMSDKKAQELEDIQQGWEKSNQELSVGKFIKRIFPEIKDTELEKFVNLYKAQISKDSKFENFELVSGEDIKKYYDLDNYVSQRGSLGNSCMRYETCQDYFGIYCDNPKQVRLLILKNENSKIEGRALVWNLTTPDCTFMDRIYTIDSSMEELFKEYAISKKWYYRISTGYSGDVNVGNPDGGNIVLKELTVKLDNVQFDYYPFIDTLYYLSLYDKTLSTNSNNSDMELQTVGGYQECEDCNGTGRYICHYCNNGEVECIECRGSGEIECSECNGKGEVTCDNCEGSGEIECDECSGSGKNDDDNECENCHGKGELICDNCEGSGDIKCDSCDKHGEIECSECNGSGEITCSYCDGENNCECDKCGGGGRL